MRNLLSRFVADQSGATAIEYSLIGVLIGVAILLGAQLVGNEVGRLFNYTGNKVNSVAN